MSLSDDFHSDFCICDQVWYFCKIFIILVIELFLNLIQGFFIINPLLVIFEPEKVSEELNYPILSILDTSDF